MTTLNVAGRTFHVRFRHARKLTHVKAITTCVIIAAPEDGYWTPTKGIDFTAIGNAICWPADNFSRRRGRLKAFANAIQYCRPLEPFRMALFAAYMEADPDPCWEVRQKLDPAVKRARWEAGWEKRKARELARNSQARAQEYP